ncbi:B12-binding domain-containing protein [Gymnodinialimonas hymeniacidonis]|uniref:cobalamin B12-binding domain-containing protein n=1 Tax=Gymnodinialimonas hymeniacidonis TaxID=3126508 RepID=UPI0034C67193
MRGLAREAIRILASRNEEQPDRLRARMDRLCEAFLSEDEEERHVAIQNLRNEGVADTEIIDHVIPEVARILGQRWADDTLSFAEVSIGSARLQETVRALIARDIVPMGAVSADHLNAPRILLIIPRPEDHTLGTFVAADQFRRLGYAVDIIVDQHARQAALELRKHQYVMVGLTIGGRRTLASARELVEIIRTTATRATPVVLGGSFVETASDLKQATGVDHVAVSVRDALEKCGLDIARADPSHNTMPSHE